MHRNVKTDATEDLYRVAVLPVFLCFVEDFVPYTTEIAPYFREGVVDVKSGEYLQGAE